MSRSGALFRQIFVDQEGAHERLALARLTTGAAILRTIWKLPPGEALERYRFDGAPSGRSRPMLDARQYEALRGVAFISVAAWTLGCEQAGVRFAANAAFAALQRHVAHFDQRAWNYNSNLNLALLMLSVTDTRGSLADPDRAPSPETASAMMAALQLYYAWVYLQSGVAKLRVGGLGWLDGRTLHGSWAELGTRLGRRLARTDRRLAVSASALSLLFELLFPVALLCAWRHREWLGAVSLTFHAAVKATLDISFWHHASYAVPLFLLPARTEHAVSAALRFSPLLTRRCHNVR
ncbi:hypothetical protein GCM10009759_45580 [Kitasatospora saccharophila]|uniref:HTTM domain-containing protein n=1 Tax=Kitasatospora saccharophila TaxID=407973 RepID=A0ABN2X9K5_9ACTN